MSKGREVIVVVFRLWILQVARARCGLFGFGHADVVDIDALVLVVVGSAIGDGHIAAYFIHIDALIVLSAIGGATADCEVAIDLIYIEVLVLIVIGGAVRHLDVAPDVLDLEPLTVDTAIGGAASDGRISIHVVQIDVHQVILVGLTIGEGKVPVDTADVYSLVFLIAARLTVGDRHVPRTRTGGGTNSAGRLHIQDDHAGHCVVIASGVRDRHSPDHVFNIHSVFGLAIIGLAVGDGHIAIHPHHVYALVIVIVGEAIDDIHVAAPVV